MLELEWEHRLLSDHPHRVVMLGGYTGVGKTQLLRQMKSQGCQVIDLEALASHSGSCFGNLEEQQQANPADFVDSIYQQWKSFSSRKVVWVEYERNYIGQLQVPPLFFRKIHQGQLIVLHDSRKRRVDRIVKDYAHHEQEAILFAASKIRKKIGWENYETFCKCVQCFQFHRAVEVVIDYYDKAYEYGMDYSTYSTVSDYYMDGENDDSLHYLLTIDQELEV